MLKEERLKLIKDMVERDGIIRNAEIKQIMDVTEMTIRRDLQELESIGILERIHGGAKIKRKLSERELSHKEKQTLFINEKKHIASIAASLIENNDTIYIGPGTTNEFIFEYINVDYIKIITNSIQIFNKFVSESRFELILVGGKFRERTGAFVGSFANETLSKMRVKKAFVGVNGVYSNHLSTANEEEGVSQSIILDSAQDRYILADHTKIDQEDFYSFYSLNKVTALITDAHLSTEIKNKYLNYTNILN